MNTRAHPWMPSSPCGAGCLPSTPPTVGLLVVALRWCVLAFAVGIVFVAAVVPCPRAVRGAVHRYGARAVLRCLGIRVELADLSDRRDHDGGLLVVAAHVSWVDVLVLTTIVPVSFVARADLLDWGALGSLARHAGVIPIARERLRELPSLVEHLDLRLRDGSRVAVFPEGTTRCGRVGGRFRSALFEAAVRAQVPVQPVGVHYVDRAGAATTEPAFVGDETMAASVRRLVRSRGGTARVVLTPLERPGADRRDLAARCERSVHRASIAPRIARTPAAAVPAPGPRATAGAVR
ncbi:MAG: 1-acyl-sn-glycerol-3-phosphate acyltransferase [Rhodococcus sp.]|uniref:lysophospholipid acyltransferase family protein n=1 Tax=Rhodococcus sp. TaxID=1831 RepID=UPI0016A98A20|nr:lysophospholipid acyltransferase family protein [Rhodococcus sp. (in: high G+C Gram-positive bacteria)]NLV78880.1 1-acyl-sn-glycerol-3-phosphate acyltransferase [Rhodococcus sp. (in: high G+C Gram-positive bacteria)]